MKVLTTTAKAVKTSAEAVGNAASAVGKGVVKLAQYCAGDGATTCLKTAGAIVVGVAAMAACPATAGVGCALAAAVVSGAIGGAMTAAGDSPSIASGRREPGLGSRVRRGTGQLT